MNACCRDMGMFQAVMPVGKRDCELLRAMQTCVRRRSGPLAGPAQPSPLEGRSVDVLLVPSLGDSHGALEEFSGAPAPPRFPGHAADVNMGRGGQGSPVCCLIAPPT